MTFDKNFEKQWLDKLQIGLKKIGKADLFNEITKDKDEHSLLKWTENLMKMLKENLTQDEINEVMTGCACITPKDYLENIRKEYAITKDLKKVHTMLQEAFEKFIRQYKNLNDEQMELLRKKGWGSAGKLEGNTILSTKIPKEFHKYFQTTDIQKKKYYYCHCPRIRDLFLNNEKTLDVNYCYCSAGFTKDIWEYILQKKVRVEIIESLMKGDAVCKIKIYI
ncbi:MAG: hypothetical protein ISS80_02875 [Candidatus Cloacimonetes bacterium]|nr:hypothetical protein [Candidatus Cloacimonadota bacterium]MBL7148995.1 hypothetical protein [Candidatus Cloacimonadota bacterium]